MSDFSPEQFAAFSDATDQIIEMLNGFRSRLESEGYSPTAAEAMTIEFFQYMLRSNEEGRKK